MDLEQLGFSKCILIVTQERFIILQLFLVSKISHVQVIACHAVILHTVLVVMQISVIIMDYVKNAQQERILVL